MITYLKILLDVNNVYVVDICIVLSVKIVDAKQNKMSIIILRGKTFM